MATKQCQVPECIDPDCKGAPYLKYFDALPPPRRFSQADRGWWGVEGLVPIHEGTQKRMDADPEVERKLNKFFTESYEAHLAHDAKARQENVVRDAVWLRGHRRAAKYGQILLRTLEMAFDDYALVDEYIRRARQELRDAVKAMMQAGVRDAGREVEDCFYH